STGTSGLLPGSQLAGGSTSYFAQLQLVSLSSGVIGTLPISSMGNLPAVSLSTGTLAGSLLSPTQMVAVSLSSQTLAGSILPPGNLAAISLSSQTIGALGSAGNATFISSNTVTAGATIYAGGGGEVVTFNLSGGSVTARNLTTIGPVQSDANGNLVNALVSLSSGVIGSLGTGSLPSMIPGANLGGGSTSYFSATELVFLSTG